jgi:hypothetical protein
MRFINNIKNFKIKNKEIITADFETLIHNNRHYLYCVGYSNLNYKNFKFLFINSGKIELESSILLRKFLNFLTLNKNTKYIYFHNLGRFAGIFILDFLEKNNLKFYSIIRNNRIYKIIYKNLIFLDSYLILPFSLHEIGCKIINIKKKNFDYFYIFSISSAYANLVNIIEHLKINIKILSKVLYIYYEKLKNLFNIDICKYYTLSSISFAIYRLKYIQKNKILVSSSCYYDFIKLSYKGGFCNINIPYLKRGYCYDINSLYPYIMQTKEMPVGRCFFILSNFKDINEYFGFIECEVYIPEKLEIPPLSIKIKGILIQPVGKFKGV